jgi:hypothetical protein
MWERRIWWVLFVVLMINGCSWSQDWSLETHEQEISGGEGDYTFDAQTILQSLARGKANVFTLQPAVQEPPKASLPPVQWSQADFYRIAQAFHESVWQEPIESWKLKLLLFKLGCEHAPLGPQFVSFKLFRTTLTRQVSSRLERNLYIEPQQNQASWIGIEYYPERFRWSSFDLAQVKIPAEQALQIAEKHGGQEVRSAVENRCWILGQLAAGIMNNNWQISYTGEELVPLLTIYVDEQTGEYKVTYRKTK